MAEHAPTVVITADETMMSRYRGGMFLGFATCSPRGILPDWLFFQAFAPPVPRKNGRAVYADCGLRMVEASLLADGFTEDEVAVVHPRDLKRMVGEETRIVAVGGHDPLGINPPTSTFVDLARTGPPYNRVKFLELVRNPALKNVKTVVGGKGAWQVANPGTMDRLGIDYVHLGEGEVSIPRMFRAILRGDDLPRIVTGEDTPVEKIPDLRRPTTHGLTEISRGCGRGCRFCTPGMQKIRHKPIEQITRDIVTNVRGGNSIALFHSEDALRYGTHRIEAEPAKVMRLFSSVAATEGVTAIGLSHIALATAYHHPDLVEQVSDLFSTLPDQTYHGAQTGIETGSARLMRRYMKGKSAPSPPEMWPEIVVQSLGMLSDHDWALACTLIVGLPGETEDDVLRTLELVDDLTGMRGLLIVPMNFVSMGGSGLALEESFTVERMTPSHWMLLGRCLEIDVATARMLKSTLIEGGPLLRALTNFAMERLIAGAERYIAPMKRGEPPGDYGPETGSYLNPTL